MGIQSVSDQNRHTQILEQNEPLYDNPPTSVVDVEQMAKVRETHIGSERDRVT